jgi:hypothetical protein
VNRRNCGDSLPILITLVILSRKSPPLQVVGSSQEGLLMAKPARCEFCQSYTPQNNIKGICGNPDNSKSALLKNRKKSESCGNYKEKQVVP